MTTTITLPVAFLYRLIAEAERIAPKSKKNPTPWWFGEDYDAGCYTIPSGPATDEDIAAQALLDDALDTYNDERQS